MKIKCVSKKEDRSVSIDGNSYKLSADGIEIGKEYDVISVEKGWYRIVDWTGEDYLYPPELFEVIEQ